MKKGEYIEKIAEFVGGKTVLVEAVKSKSLNRNSLENIFSVHFDSDLNEKFMKILMEECGISEEERKLRRRKHFRF